MVWTWSWLLWIKNEPINEVNTNEKIENFVSKYISCDVSLLPITLQNAQPQHIQTCKEKIMLFINSIINSIYLNQNNIYLLAKILVTTNNIFFNLKKIQNKWKHYIPKIFETLRFWPKYIHIKLKE
jgi:hypothetical protein